MRKMSNFLYLLYWAVPVILWQCLQLYKCLLIETILMKNNRGLAIMKVSCENSMHMLLL